MFGRKFWCVVFMVMSIYALAFWLISPSVWWYSTLEGIRHGWQVYPLLGCVVMALLVRNMYCKIALIVFCGAAVLYFASAGAAASWKVLLQYVPTSNLAIVAAIALLPLSAYYAAQFVQRYRRRIFS